MRWLPRGDYTSTTKATTAARIAHSKNDGNSETRVSKKIAASSERGHSAKTAPCESAGFFIGKICYTRPMKSHSIEDTTNIAKGILENLGDGPAFLALSGDLGSGKTSFVQQLAKILGVKENITSPTFVIMQSYPISFRHFETLIHVDAYRLESSEALEKLRWQEYLANPKNLICLEWPERVPACIPQWATKIQFTFIDETTRQIEIV